MLGLVAAHSEGGVDYGIRETHAVLGSDCRLNRPAVIAWCEPNAPWKGQPRGLGPRLVDPPAVSEEGDLVVGRTRLRHPGERPRGLELRQPCAFPAVRALQPDFSLGRPTSSCADSCPGRGRPLGLGHLAAGLPGAREDFARASVEGGAVGWIRCPSAANVGWSLVGSRLTPRIPTSAAKLKNENVAPTGILRCRVGSLGSIRTGAGQG